jgi:3-hydroxybutyryl-CoA dehydrogenase
VAANSASAFNRLNVKQAVLLHKEMPGFLVNWILRALSNEAYFLLENGVASFEGINNACRLGLNHPLGPFQLSDFSGLDIGYNARMEIFNRTGDEEVAPAPSLKRRVERGRPFYDSSG